MTFPWFRIPVTRRSASVDASLLRTLPAEGVARVEHVLRVPRGACPVSGNPLSGSLTISYDPAGLVLEVVSLDHALRWACSGAPGAPRSAEALAAWAATTARPAVGVPVRVRLDLTLRPGGQRLVVEVTR
jgi:hypothetical protein